MIKKTLLLFIFFALISIKIGNADFNRLITNSLPAISSRFNSHCISHQLRNDDSEFTGSADFDNQITKFIAKYGIKGASLAVSYKGHLVYAKGYGYADAENKLSMEPYHLLRIASVSKLLTASGIMHLIDQSKLSLDSKVFGHNGILNDSIYSGYRDKRYEKITIRHLLSHTAGWSKRNGDPVFEPQNIAQALRVSYPVDIKSTIRYALRYSLSYQPGSRYSYSNLGYVILGEIISKLSKMNYEDYIESEILVPIGILDMHIGNSYYEDHLWNETKYYESRKSPLIQSFDGTRRMVPRIYGGSNIKLLGAAGGWLASPSELLRFVLAIDGQDDFPNIISHSSIEAMTNPDQSTQRLLGWCGKDDDGNLWRTGSLAGTNALVVHKSNGLAWVIILNTSAYHQKAIPYAILQTMAQALDKVKKWPDYDLFTFKKMDLAIPKLVSFVN
jgi:CubicO group peptidase (beta-lactamase class C family)